MNGAGATRIERVDALRGLALLGILQVNIQSYTWGPGDVLGYLAQPPGAGESLLYFLQAAFIEGKCYPVFAFLFGLGLALQARSLQRLLGDEAGVRRVLARRLAFLLGLGLLHGLLLYYGDVLFAYAACGLVSLVLLRPPVRARSLAAYAWLAALAAALSLFSPFLVDRLLGSPAEPAEVASAGQADVPEAPALPALEESIAAAHEVYTGQGYGAQLAQRLGDEAWQQAGSVLSFWPQVLLLFALGALAGRLGWVRHPQRHPRVWAWARRLGLGLGLPCALLGAALDLEAARATPGLSDNWSSVASGLGSLLAAAYVAGAIRLFDRLPVLRRALALAGRMSLSNYLLQSLLMGLLLSGWGLGWGAQLGRGALAMLALAIFALQAVASRAWLARHRQGPMEALWRRWTYRGVGAGGASAG